MAERPKSSIIWRVLRGLLSGVLGLLLVLSLVLAIYITNIRGTLLNPSFIDSELRKGDLYSAGKEILAEQKDKFLGELGEQGERIYKILETSLSADWMQSQVRALLSNVFSYLNKESDDLDLSFSLAGLKDNFKTSLSQSIRESPPEGLKDLPPKELDRYLEQAYRAIDSLPPEIRVEVSSLEALEPVRDIMEGLKQVNYLLIAVALLFALLLILLNFRVRAASRALGFPVLLGGAMALVAGKVATTLAGGLLSRMEFPSPLKADMVTTLVKDFLAAPNLLIYALMAVGLLLIVISFLYKERSPAVSPVS